MNRILYFVLFGITGCLCACRPTPTQTMLQALEAEQLLNSRPDSLATLLEEKINPTLLCDSDRAYYWLLLTQAHERTGRALVNDSMIHFSAQYYKEKQSPRWPMACMMAADQVNYSGEKKQEQIQRYCEAVEAAKIVGDSTSWRTACTTLAKLYWRYREPEKGVETARKVLANSTSDDQRITSWFQMGLAYTKLNGDSAYYCMNQSMQLARETKNGSEFHITRNLAEYLTSINKNREALQLLDELEQRLPDCNHESLSFSRLLALLSLGEVDAAKPYLELMEQVAAKYATSNDAVTLQYTTRVFRLIYNAQRKVPLNFTHYGQYNDSIENARWAAHAIEKEQYLAQNKLIRDKQELQTEKQQLHQVYMAIVLVIVILLAVLIFIYQRKLLLKERSIQAAREQMRSHIIRLRENESIISRNEEQIQHISAQLEERSALNEQLSGQQAEITEISRYNNELQQENNQLQQEINQYARALIQKDKSTEMYEQLIERCDLLAEREKQLSAKLTDLIDILKNLKSGVYSHLSDVDWPQVYSSLNQIFNNYTQRLQRDFPLLTEEDIQCCCLIKLRMTTSAIANIYSITPASATKRKQRIRERINQSKEQPLDKNLSIDIFLWEY